MKKIYRIFNPYSGVYSDAEELQAIPKLLAEAAWSAYMTLTHQNPVVEITVNTDGSQVWRNMEGQVIPSPEDLEELTARFVQNLAPRIPDPLPIEFIGVETNAVEEEATNAVPAVETLPEENVDFADFA